jgi:hypothetical protein
MRKALKIALLAGILMGLGIAQAQQLQEQPKHPGDVLKFEVKFEGPDADKIKYVSLNLGLAAGSSLEKQVGFNQGLSGASRIQVAPRTFHIEVIVTDDIASGDYTLSQLNAGAEVGGENYPQRDFQGYRVHIENPRTFIPPKVSIKPLP